jgi:hypothetical protein
MTAGALYLILKRIWYDKIDCGDKRIEYRDDTPYWRARLLIPMVGGNTWPRSPRRFEEVEFRNGYRRDSRRMRFKIHRILLPYAARSGKFEIHLGERLS